MLGLRLILRCTVDHVVGRVLSTRRSIGEPRISLLFLHHSWAFTQRTRNERKCRNLLRTSSCSSPLVQHRVFKLHARRDLAEIRLTLPVSTEIGRDVLKSIGVL